MGCTTAASVSWSLVRARAGEGGFGLGSEGSSAAMGTKRVNVGVRWLPEAGKRSGTRAGSWPGSCFPPGQRGEDRSRLSGKLRPHRPWLRGPHTWGSWAGLVLEAVGGSARSSPGTPEQPSLLPVIAFGQIPPSSGCAGGARPGQVAPHPWCFFGCRQQRSRTAGSIRPSVRTRCVWVPTPLVWVGWAVGLGSPWLEGLPKLLPPAAPLRRALLCCRTPRFGLVTLPAVNPGLCPTKGGLGGAFPPTRPHEGCRGLWLAGLPGLRVLLSAGAAGAFEGELTSPRAPKAQGAERACPPAEVPRIKTQEHAGAEEITDGE
ncbi:LOW QUALITY PROTEIN: uncharacterized protein ACIBXB_001190 [Morphnus guianensis]